MSLIETLVGENRERKWPGLIEREFSFSSASGKVKVAIGVRRSGKTFFQFQQIKKLLQEKIPSDRILYINFEDERLLPLDAKGLGELLDSFYALYPDNHQHKCYFFLDEIQNVEGWPVVIRRFLDTRKVELFLTGSSAKLLSKEIATSLRGRALTVEVWPYSFNEFLKSKKRTPFPHILGPSAKDHFVFLLRQYLKQGGFPEIIKALETDHKAILQDYVNTVIYRDLIERHKLTNLTLLKYLVKTLLRMPGQLFSTHKFFKDLKSQGIGVSKDSVYDYLGFIEDTYLAFTVPLLTSSFRKQSVNPKKIYLIDSGLVRANTFQVDANWGSFFENLVFLDLKRYGWEPFYYQTKEGFEVDFAARNKKGKLKLFQVCADLSTPKTLGREERALLAGKKELGVNGEIVTMATYHKFLEEVSRE